MSTSQKEFGTITILRPPNSLNKEEPPLGIGYVAAYLDATEFKGNVAIIDCEASGLNTDRKITDALKQNNTKILGISFFTYDRYSAQHVAVLAKQLGIVTIAGGVHVSSDPLGTLTQCPEFDYGVIGEGEITFYELIKSIVANVPPNDIKSVVWRNGAEVILNDRRELIKDLDSLPFPAYHLMPMKMYKSHALIGSRGCPNVCKFCASPLFWQKKLRFRSPSNLLDEVEHLLANFGNKPVRFKDDTFTCKPSWAIEVCSGIRERGITIEWDLLARATGLQEDVLIAARQAGAYKIRIGIESGNEEIRNGINKQLTTEDIYRSVDLARKTGFASIGTFFMIGLPGETAIEIQQTFDMCSELDADYISFKPADIYPNTGLYDIAVEKKLIPHPFPWFDPQLAGRYPNGFLVYKGVPTFTEHFGRIEIVDIASSLYLKYFAEKLFVKGIEPRKMFFEEMEFAGISHHRPFLGMLKLIKYYFKAPNKKRRWKGFVFVVGMLKESLWCRFLRYIKNGEKL